MAGGYVVMRAYGYKGLGAACSPIESAYLHQRTQRIED